MCCGQKVVENGGTDGLESGGNSVGNYNSGGPSIVGVAFSPS